MLQNLDGWMDSKRGKLFAQAPFTALNTLLPSLSIIRHFSGLQVLCDAPLFVVTGASVIKVFIGNNVVCKLMEPPSISGERAIPCVMLREPSTVTMVNDRGLKCKLKMAAQITGSITRSGSK